MSQSTNKDTKHYAHNNLMNTKNYSHMDGGIMDGWWRGVGDDDGDDLLQFPVSAGCQNRDFWSRFEVSGRRRRRGTLSGNMSLSSEFLGSREYIARRGGPGATRGGHTPQTRPRVDPRLGQVWVPRGPSALLLLAPWIFGSKNDFYKFTSWFPESQVSAHKQDTKVILLKTALVRVSSIQKHTR